MFPCWAISLTRFGGDANRSGYRPLTKKPGDPVPAQIWRQDRREIQFFTGRGKAVKNV
jgi:hypothetical protein